MPIHKKLSNLFNHRYLLWMWIVREIRLRYKQTFLGGIWAILQPLALVLMFTAVFSIFARVPSDGFPYPVFSYTGLLPWTFIATSVTFGTSSLVNNMNLVTKVNIPREALPIASVGASLVDFALAGVVFGILLWFFHIGVSQTAIWLPLLIVVQVALAVGVVLFSSALNVFFRDIRFAVPLALQLWMYASPIIYPLSAVPERIRGLYLLNPVAGLVVTYRMVILDGQAPTLTILGPTVLVSLSILIAGYIFFKRVDWQFADII